MGGTPTIDYDALAAKYGGTPAQSSAPDYDAIAAKYGGTAQPDPAAQDQATADINQAATRTMSAPLQPEFQSPAKQALQPFEQPKPLTDAEREFNQGLGPQTGYQLKSTTPGPQTIAQQEQSFTAPKQLTPVGAAPQRLAQPSSGVSPELPADPFEQGFANAVNGATADVRNPKNPLTATGNPMLAEEAKNIQQIRDGMGLVNDNWNNTAEDNSDLIMRGFNQVATGLMNASMPALTAEIGANPAAARSILLGISAGLITGKAAEKGVQALGGSPDAQALAQTIGFVLPSAAGAMAGLETGESRIGNEGKGYGVSAFGGRVQAGVGVTPEEYGAGIRVGGRQGNIIIPRNPAEPTPALPEGEQPAPAAAEPTPEPTPPAEQPQPVAQPTKRGKSDLPTEILGDIPGTKPSVAAAAAAAETLSSAPAEAAGEEPATTPEQQAAGITPEGAEAGRQRLSRI